jgi:hypothetical protein
MAAPSDQNLVDFAPMVELLSGVVPRRPVGLSASTIPAFPIERMASISQAHQRTCLKAPAYAHCIVPVDGLFEPAKYPYAITMTGSLRSSRRWEN